MNFSSTTDAPKPEQQRGTPQLEGNRNHDAAQKNF